MKIYNQYKDRADFLAVYIREAHPTDEWEMKDNIAQDVCYPQPKTLAQRVAIANDFVKRFNFPIPIGIDAMTDYADHLYGGWPERLYVIDESGKIVYRGGMGPFDYHPAEVSAWLARRFPQVRTAKLARLGMGSGARQQPAAVDSGANQRHAAVRAN